MRKSGYYWVRKGEDNWFIAKWSSYLGSGHWDLSGCIYYDKWWDEINETPIERKPQLSEANKQLLDEYTLFLVKNGYCDSDVYDEPPTAIDRFMHPNLNK